MLVHVDHLPFQRLGKEDRRVSVHISCLFFSHEFKNQRDPNKTYKNDFAPIDAEFLSTAAHRYHSDRLRHIPCSYTSLARELRRFTAAAISRGDRYYY